MQLTRAADYAIRVMIHMATMPPGSRVSRAELADAAECPQQFLSKVLQSLTRAGLVISHRGNTGGFELPHVHRSASLLEVVEAIEGPVRLNLCLTSEHACSRQSWCPAHPVWIDAQKAMAGVLQSVTVASLAEKVASQSTNGKASDITQWN